MQRRRGTRVGVAGALLLAAGLAGLAAQAQAPPAPAKVRLAEEQFKNIQFLKGVPAGQVIPSMQFIANALGVECSFCHVEGAFDKDDKKTKQTARSMMRMMVAINVNNFDGERKVTCNTCHRGAPRPEAIPAIGEEAKQTAALSEEAEPGPAPGTPAPDALVERYIEAAGGAEAIEKVTSRAMKGTAMVNGHAVPIDIFAKDPGKRLSVMHMKSGDSLTAYDGHGGWMGNPGRPAREMEAGEADSAALDAELRLPVRIAKLFSQLNAGPETTIAGSKAYQVVGIREGKPPVRMYFDEKSGLLVRMVRYVDTPLGLNPAEVNYADYRDLGGVKVPYRWTLARPLGQFTIQIEEAQQNVPVDDSKFDRPAVPAVK